MKICMRIIGWLLFMSSACHAGEPGTFQYDDPRIRQWNALLLAGKPAELLSALTADLKSASPHLQASAVWTELQRKGGRLPEAIERAKNDDVLMRSLGPMPRLQIIYDQSDYVRLFAEFPPEKLTGESNPWVFINLAWAAREVGDVSLEAQYLLMATASYPVNASLIDRLMAAAIQRSHARDAVVKAISQDGILARTPAGEFLRRFLPLERAQPVDEASAWHEWQKSHPDDLSVHQVLAEKYYGLEMFAAAADSYMQYLGAFALYNTPRGVAKYLTRVERNAEVDRWTTLMTATPHQDRKREAARANFYRAEGAVNSGWLGRARDIIASSDKAVGMDAEMAALLGRIELAHANRKDHAADWYQVAIEKNPNDPDALVGLVRAFNETKRGRLALDLCEQKLGSPSARSTEFHWRCADIASESGRGSLAHRFADAGLALYPHDRALRLTRSELLAKDGSQSEAEKLAWSLIEENPQGSQGAVALLAEPLSETGRIAFAESITRKYPHARKEVLKAALSKVGTPAAKQALVEKLSSEFREDASLLRYRMSLLEDEKKYGAAMEGYKKLLNEAQTLTLNDKRNLCIDVAWLYDKLNGLGKLSAGQSSDFRSLMLRWSEIEAGSLPYLWHNALSQLVSGNVEEAKRDFERHARLDPTHGGYLQLHFRSPAFRDSAKASVLLSWKVERDPFDGGVLSNNADVAIYYLGSPVSGLQYLSWVRERDPNHFNEKSEAMALSQLGVSDALARSFQQSTALSNSERYIDWFATSRKKAISGASGALSFTAPFEVKIVRPDGSELTLRENARSGRVEYARIGAAFYEARYSPDGARLERIWNSLGEDVTLTYDERDNITGLARKGGDSLRIVYDDQRRPVRMEIPKAGELRVTYGADGEIASVESPQGTKMAMRLTQMMSQLNEMARGISAQGVERLLREGRDDAQVAELRAKLRGARDKTALMKLRLQLAERLVQVVGMNGSYQDEASGVIEAIVDAANSSAGREWKNGAIAAIGLQHQLALATHPAGLGSADYREILALEGKLALLLAQGGDRKLVDKVRSQMRANPAKLLPSARWMPVSDFLNPGYWRAFSRAEIIPAKFTTARLQGVLPLRNRDIIAATTSGFSVNHSGVWHWYSLPASIGRVNDSLDNFEAGAHNQIKALAQTDDGALWFGTANGVYRTLALGEPVRLWRTAKQGLAAPSVIQILAAGNSVTALTERALSRLDPDSSEPAISEIPDGALAVAAAPIPAGGDGRDGPDIAVATNLGVYLRSSGKWKKVFDKAAQSVSFVKLAEGPGQLFVLSGTQVFEVLPGGATPSPLQGQHEIVFAKAIRGLAGFTDGSSPLGLAIPTDSGLAVLKDGVIEHTTLDIGLTDRVPDVREVVARDRSLYLLTDNEVMFFEKSNVRHVAGRVNRIRVHDEAKTVWFLQEGQLKAIEDGKITSPLPLRARLNSFALAGNGDLIVHEGNRIVRIDRMTKNASLLFEATSAARIDDTNQELYPESVKDILASTGGDLWVLTSRSVYRFRDGQSTEFSWHLDKKSFPFPSDMLYRIHEFDGGTVAVVASDEGHRQYNGEKLAGGLAIFNGKRFVARGNSDESWFVTARTPIDSTTSILGTTDGFAELRNGEIRRYTDIGNKSYGLLRQKQPALYIGTRGAKLGEETYLFGSAGGLVGWYRGEWFAADRLNRLLPEDKKFANRGGRTIHDVANDQSGQIYVGTDIGLMIYSGADSEGIAFLRANKSPDAALVVTEDQKRTDEKERFLKSLPAQSGSARLRDDLIKLRAEVGRLTVAASSPSMPAVGAETRNAEGAGSSGSAVASTANLKGQLGQREREVQLLMARIQAEDPSLHTMLELKPFDLQAVRASLKEGDLVLQPVPMRNSLLIHVVTRDGFDAKVIGGVGRELLFERAVQLQNLMEKMTQGKVAGASKLRAEIDSLLDWFYQMLVFPVERDVGAAKRLLFSGTGPLNYLPVAALSKNFAGERKYLLDVFPNLSTASIPSLYVFQLSRSNEMRPGRNGALVVGNPTEDLADAELEAKEVAATLGGGAVSLMRSAATKKAFVGQAGEARWLHLAMHGVLDPEDTYSSALLFAGAEHLSLLDVMGLKLTGVDGAVLSACKSGKGRTGNEYTTLAWSFMHAGVPTVLATLWAVPDLPTRLLMGHYYRELARTDSPQTALAMAQRAMLTKYRERPEAWAAFVAFGK